MIKQYNINRQDTCDALKISVSDYDYAKKIAKKLRRIDRICRWKIFGKWLTLRIHRYHCLKMYSKLVKRMKIYYMHLCDPCGYSLYLSKTPGASDAIYLIGKTQGSVDVNAEWYLID